MNDILNILTIIAGIAFVLFLPGLLLSFLLFTKKQIDYLERLALSFALSIAVVPLLVFYTNLIGIMIIRESVLIQIGGLIIIMGAALLIEYRHQESVKT